MNSLRSSQSKSNCEENSKYNDDSYESDNKQNPIDNLCLNLKRKRERGNSMLSSSSSFSFKAPLALSSKTQSIISSILSKKNKASVINYKPPTLSLPIIKSVNKEKTSMPKASTFKISQKTLEVINKLKMERKNRFEREKKENEMKRRESSFSLRFKYEDLIKEHRELPLPLKYKALLNTFIELDNVIDASKTLRNIVPTFEYLVSTIEQTYHHRFNLTMFQQILHLVPSFFIYQYKKKENDYELMIDIPKDFDERAKLDKNEFSKIQNKYDPIISAMTTQMKEKRITIFKSSLYEIVKEFHTKFLKDNHYKEFDPFIEKTWHHSFELNSVDNIPLYKIEEKPTVTNKFQESIKELTKNDPVLTIIDAEPIGPKNMIDLMLIAPCTGNTVAKLTYSIIDDTILMATKSHLRNNKPVVLGISTNDALGLSAKNIGALLAAKNFYFVPFGQDAPESKPNSLTFDIEKIVPTIELALEGKQIQPILKK